MKEHRKESIKKLNYIFFFLQIYIFLFNRAIIIMSFALYYAVYRLLALNTYIILSERLNDHSLFFCTSSTFLLNVFFFLNDCKCTFDQ